MEFTSDNRVTPHLNRQLFRRHTNIFHINMVWEGAWVSLFNIYLQKFCAILIFLCLPAPCNPMIERIAICWLKMLMTSFYISNAVH